MRTFIVTVAVLLFIKNFSCAQLTLAHSFAKPLWTESEIVDLSNSGKKIMTFMNKNSPNLADTIYFYNMDYSFWKSIPCPAIPGFAGQFNIFHDAGQDVGIFYPSETLFNLDPLLEVVVFYSKYGTDSGKFLIINETGSIIDSIVSAAYDAYPFRVFSVDTLGIGLQAVVSTTTGINIYNLPGTLPCEVCNNSVGLTLNTNTQPRIQKADIRSEPLPNPSSNDVKISFTLPEGTRQGELNLYSTNGQLIRTYKVDDRFGYIMLDNSQLPSGMYYYNIIANGIVSSTQKMVLVK